MGAQKTDPKGPNYAPDVKDDADPVREVTLGPFMIAKDKVKLPEWKLIMGRDPPFALKENCIDGASFDESREFCWKAGLRLPTIAEWIYACRAGKPFAVGEKVDRSAEETGFKGPALTGPLGPDIDDNLKTRFGLLEIHRNVHETCIDQCDDRGNWRREAMEVDPSVYTGEGLRPCYGPLP